ncbi:MAG: DUF1460 domain-containing protein [Longimicrobiales bacterium]
MKRLALTPLLLLASTTLLSLALTILLALLSLTACGGDGAPEAQVRESEEWEGDVVAAARLLRPPGGTEADWEILREKALWSWELGLDTLSMGESMAFIGLSFVGTRYVPNTLDLPGSEQVVVNLQEMDCVTFVENVLALAHFIRETEPETLESDIETRKTFERILTRIRYRGGRVDGYPSRLHYFSHWILDNEAKGLVREVTVELGGVEDYRAIDFMSSHPESYRQMADPLVFQAVQDLELYLSGLTRYRIPQDEIDTWSSWIRDGDIIAATSTVEGLDVAHTGLALWRDGILHLLHAPNVGEAVELSRLPLAERILRIESMDGIRVVRPVGGEAGAEP